MFWYRLFRKSDDGRTITPKSGTILVPSTVALNQTYPGTRCVYTIQIATSGSNGNTDIIVPNKMRVLDCCVIQQAATVTSETIQVFNGSNAISSAMALSGSDTTIVRTATINDAYWDLNVGDTLRCTTAGGASQPQCVVIVKGVLLE
jgi:hypothetical protein